MGSHIRGPGDLIGVPVGLRDSWDQDFSRYWRGDLLPRDRGKILAFCLKGELGVCPVEKIGGQKFHPDAETLTMKATIDHREVRLQVNTTVFSHHDVRKSSYGTGS